MSYFAGIDVGAATTKAVIIDAKKKILGYAVTDSGADFKAAAERAFDDSRGKANIASASADVILSTGYGLGFATIGAG